MPILWWARRWTYVRFVVRELTSVAVATYAIVLLLLIRAVAEGPGAYQGFMESLRSPLAIALHVVILFMAVYHSITWFNLAPKAMVIRVGSRTVPGRVIAAANFAAWVVLSVALAWVLAA